MHGHMWAPMHHFLSVCLSVCDWKNHQKRSLEYVKVKGHMCQGQRSIWSKSNKDSKERQVGSQQGQAASFKVYCQLIQFSSPLQLRHPGIPRVSQCLECEWGAEVPLECRNSPDRPLTRTIKKQTAVVRVVEVVLYHWEGGLHKAACVLK